MNRFFIYCKIESVKKIEIDYHSLTDEKIKKLLGVDNIGIGGKNSEKVDLSAFFKQIKKLFDELFDFKLISLTPHYSKEGILNGFEINNGRNFIGEPGLYKPSSLTVWNFVFDLSLDNFKAGYCNMVLDFDFEPVYCDHKYLDELKFIGDTQYMGHFAYSCDEQGRCNGLGIRGNSETTIEFFRDTLTLENFLKKFNCVQQILNGKKA